jgi:hypothetical protein
MIYVETVFSNEICETWGKESGLRAHPTRELSVGHLIKERF